MQDIWTIYVYIPERGYYGLSHFDNKETAELAVASGKYKEETLIARDFLFHTYEEWAEVHNREVGSSDESE